MPTVVDYSTLVAKVKEWRVRTDSFFTDQIDQFIQNTESETKRRLRVRDMIVEGSIAFAAGNNEGALPAFFGRIRGEPWIDGDDGAAPLKQVAPSTLRATKISTLTGKPVAHSIVGLNMLVGPVPDTDYTIKFWYHQELQALTTEATTNWLILRYPDVYLYGCLLHSYIWTNAPDATVAKYQALFANALDGIRAADQADRWNSAPLDRVPLIGTPLRKGNIRA